MRVTDDCLHWNASNFFIGDFVLSAALLCRHLTSTGHFASEEAPWRLSGGYLLHAAGRLGGHLMG